MCRLISIACDLELMMISGLLCIFEKVRCQMIPVSWSKVSHQMSMLTVLYCTR